MAAGENIQQKVLTAAAAATTRAVHVGGKTKLAAMGNDADSVTLTMTLQVSVDGTAWFDTAGTLVWAAASGVRVTTVLDSAWAMARLVVTSGSAATIDAWISAN